MKIEQLLKEVERLRCAIQKAMSQLSDRKAEDAERTLRRCFWGTDAEIARVEDADIEYFEANPE